MLSNISAFIWAVLSHWQSYLTGGVVTAVIGLIERFSNWKMPRKWYAILFVGVFLLVSFFLAWRDQYQIAQTVPGLEQKVKDQDQIIQGLKERPPQINMPPAIVNIPSVS